MIKLFRAIKAENIKLYSKLSSKLFLAVILLMAIVVSLCVRSVTQAEDLPDFFSSGHAGRAAEEFVPSDNWTQDGEAQIAKLVTSMDELTETIKNKSGTEKYAAQKEYDVLLREASVMRYRIDNGIAPSDDSGWDKAVFVFWLLALVMCPLYLICVSDIFAGEFSRSTARTILPRPITRIKQYTAKLITAIVYGIVMLSIAAVGSVVSCAAVCGGLGDSRYIGWFSGGVLDCGRGTLIVMILLCLIASYAVIAAMCAAVGMLTRSRAASCAVCGLTFVISWLLGEAVCAGGSTVAGLSIFAVLDLTVPLMQTPNCVSFGFNTAAVCAAAYFAVFSFLGYSFFKKDV